MQPVLCVAALLVGLAGGLTIQQEQAKLMATGMPPMLAHYKAEEIVGQHKLLQNPTPAPAPFVDCDVKCILRKRAADQAKRIKQGMTGFEAHFQAQADFPMPKAVPTPAPAPKVQDTIKSLEQRLIKTQGLSPFEAHFKAREMLQKEGINPLNVQEKPKGARANPTRALSLSGLTKSYIKKGMDPLSAHFKALQVLKKKGQLPENTGGRRSRKPQTVSELQEMFEQQGLDPLTARLKAAVIVAKREGNKAPKNMPGSSREKGFSNYKEPTTPPKLSLRNRKPTSAPTVKPAAQQQQQQQQQHQQQAPAAKQQQHSQKQPASSQPKPAAASGSGSGSSVIGIVVVIVLLVAGIGGGAAMGLFGSGEENAEAEEGEGGGGAEGGSYQSGEAPPEE